MPRPFIWFLLFGMSLGSSSQVFGKDLGELVRKLLKAPVNYEVIGNVCEQLAKLKSQELFPEDEYEIFVGIEYGHRNGRVLGELDLVVSRKHDREVVRIGEVKCWRKLSGALAKAKMQLERFRSSISRIPQRLEFTHRNSTNPEAFQVTQFDEEPEYVSIAQQGAVAQGFDEELDLSLNEVIHLQKRLVEQQRRRFAPYRGVPKLLNWPLRALQF